MGSRLIGLVVAALACVLLVLLGLKMFAGRLAHPLTKDWSESGQCYVVMYAPGYGALGMVGRVLELFSSPYFFRVFTKDGTLLESSEWKLWLKEAEGVAPEFHGQTFFFPGMQGWETWTVPECA